MFAKFRDSVKKEFNKLTGSTEEENTHLVELAEDCTAESVLAPDEARIGQLISLINAGDIGCVPSLQAQGRASRCALPSDLSNRRPAL